MLKDEIIQSAEPFVIAGPCSAETEEQVISTCTEIARNREVKMLRAGIWKPRTRPDSFEGLGGEALPWLVEAGRQTGLRTVTEVANAKHVEEVLRAGIDAIWIGARTTVNPFTVQEIADALKGVQIPVLIKNPVNPDLGLWIGAFERFINSGNQDLTAIHRGFSSYRHPKYRNVPSWEIPIALKEELPEIPLICDPSHITGKRELLLEVSQKALDLDFNGLMIEVHPDPEYAWSDKEQQIKPIDFSQLLRSLIRRHKSLDPDVQEMIAELRTKVSTLDDRIFELLSERMRLSQQVGKIKQENNITILQQGHWSRLLNERLAQADDFGLSKKFVRELLDAIHQESIRHQTKIMNPDSGK
ncbi:MAG: 3-deoxy-7-phosphoheptulonate synthase [Deltaproteobacteria bacterium]|nr:MAG: 3-deoxy-7-phosphoheptulonate synthase [Deltaproteobacteria bacterium]